MILHIGKGDSIAINSVKFYQRNDRIILTSYGKSGNIASYLVPLYKRLYGFSNLVG